MNVNVAQKVVIKGSRPFWRDVRSNNNNNKKAALQLLTRESHKCGHVFAIYIAKPKNGLEFVFQRRSAACRIIWLVCSRRNSRSRWRTMSMLTDALCAFDLPTSSDSSIVANSLDLSTMLSKCGYDVMQRSNTIFDFCNLFCSQRLVTR